MNILKIVNLIGRITHLYVAKDKAFIGKEGIAKTYLDDFLSIKKKDIEEAFDFLIPQCIDRIWQLLEADQALYSGDDAIDNLRHFALPANTVAIMIMCKRIVSE